MHEKIKKILKSEYLLLAGAILFLLMLNYLLVKPLISIPGPLYGGDLYFQLSQTNHFKYGGSLLHASNIIGALPFYMVDYTVLTGIIARTLSVSAIAAHFIGSYLIIIMSCLMIFFLSKRLFSGYNFPFIGIFALLIFVRATYFPVIKYTVFAHLVLMPLLLLALYKYLKKKNYPNAALLGAAYGLVGLGHAIAFISSTFLLALVFFYYEAGPLFKEKMYAEGKKLIQWIFSLRFFVLVVLIGVCIALLWWYKPVFIHHGQIPVEQRESGTVSFEKLSMQVGYAYNTIKGFFFNFQDAFESILSILTIFGVFGLFLMKSNSFESRFLKFLSISSIIILFHYFITQNFFGTFFVPEYINYLLVVPVRILIISLGLITAHTLLLRTFRFQRTKLSKIIFVSALLLLFVVLQFKAYQDRGANDRWYSAGMSPLPPQLLSLQDYLVKNTEVYDTILTTKEVGFAVNALTGRKLVLTRRAHNDPFFNLEPRDLDAAIMLYGNDSQKTAELLHKYGVKYVYWDYYWIQSEYIFDQQGKLTSWYDPIMLFRTNEKEAELRKYNVSYFVENTWIDPSVKGDDVKKYDLIFVSPANYKSFSTPWNPALGGFLTEVWRYDQKNVTIATLYKVNM